MANTLAALEKGPSWRVKLHAAYPRPGMSRNGSPLPRSITDSRVPSAAVATVPSISVTRISISKRRRGPLRLPPRKCASSGIDNESLRTPRCRRRTARRVNTGNERLDRRRDILALSMTNRWLPPGSTSTRALGVDCPSIALFVEPCFAIECDVPSQVNHVLQAGTQVLRSAFDHRHRSTFLGASVGHAAAAAGRYLLSRSATASRLSVHRCVGNSGSPDAARRSVIHWWSSRAVVRVSGVQRCLRPLPVQRRWAPLPSYASRQVNEVSSDTRSPVWTATSQQ
jgi:hypothetical protein